LLDINFDDEVFVLSDEQRAAIKEAEEQIMVNSVTSEQAHKQTEEWLKRKSSGQKEHKMTGTIYWNIG
jgi:hypothetical protein